MAPKFSCDTSTIQDASPTRVMFLHRATSTLQDTCMDYPLHPHVKMQSGLHVPTNSRYSCDYNSGEGPKHRLPQWLGANYEANTNNTICLGFYHLFTSLELSLNSACPTQTIIMTEWDSYFYVLCHLCLVWPKEGLASEHTAAG